VKFDVVLTNPPFHDRTARGRTPHKLWIDFTEAAFTTLLKPGGLLLQISPASFRSPSNRVLRLMRALSTSLINFDIAHHFPGVGSSFAYYAIRNTPARGRDRQTTVVCDGVTSQIVIGPDVLWLPNDLCAEALSIHRKVMFPRGGRLPVLHDYVTCHNTTLGSTLSKVATAQHVHPVFHTNPQIWWTSIRQPWADLPKVLWTRSGYTKPFFDAGVYGGTDMVYRVVTETETAGRNLLHNLSLPLIVYVLKTARWSGFGNEVVFASLPDLPTDRQLSADEICDLFAISTQEREYVQRYLG